jgi:1-deoxy-D-xylulose-5-phosphate synthase
MTPADEQEQWLMLNTGYAYNGPAAVRYPRGSGSCPEPICNDETLPIGKARLLLSGTSGTAVLNFGPLLPEANEIAKKGQHPLVAMRFVKPLDTELLSILMKTHQSFISIEDHAIQGGAGSAVAEFIAQSSWHGSLKILGIPDQWVEHATRKFQYSENILTF